MKCAYADPPYPGMAHRYGCAEVNHEWLIRDLCECYPDGWALSTGAQQLQEVLRLCPSDIRLGSWVKPWAAWKPGVRVAYAWEPVIWRGGRTRSNRVEDTIRDYTICNIRQPSEGKFYFGAKPEAFCWWVFDLLGLTPADELVDLFYGSGAVTRAWERYRTERLFVQPTETPHPELFEEQPA